MKCALHISWRRATTVIATIGSLLTATYCCCFALHPSVSGKVLPDCPFTTRWRRNEMTGLTAPAIGTDRPDPSNGVALWLPLVHTGNRFRAPSRLEFTVSRILGLGGERRASLEKMDTSPTFSLNTVLARCKDRMISRWPSVLLLTMPKAHCLSHLLSQPAVIRHEQQTLSFPKRGSDEHEH